MSNALGPISWVLMFLYIITCCLNLFHPSIQQRSSITTLVSWILEITFYKETVVFVIKNYLVWTDDIKNQSPLKLPTSLNASVAGPLFQNLWMSTSCYNLGQYNNEWKLNNYTVELQFYKSYGIKHMKVLLATYLSQNKAIDRQGCGS